MLNTASVPLQEDRVHSEELFRGRFLHAFRDTVRLPDSNTATREFVVHPGAVMVIPLIEDGQRGWRVVMERQFRYPVGQVMVEFPAGKLDPQESTLACAQRELREETGYRASHWARAGVLHPVIAYSTEFIEVWFAKGLQAGERALDAGEFLEVFDMDLETLFHACMNGEITDAKTLVGAFWLQAQLHGSLPLEWQSVDTPREPA